MMALFCLFSIFSFKIILARARFDFEVPVEVPVEVEVDVEVEVGDRGHPCQPRTAPGYNRLRSDAGSPFEERKLWKQDQIEIGASSRG